MVTVAVSRCRRSRSCRWKLDVADQLFELLASLGSRKLNAYDTTLEQFGDLGPLELWCLGDDGKTIVPGGQDRIGKIGGAEKDVLVFDVDEIESCLLVESHKGGSHDLAKDPTHQDFSLR
jgi:hypothetical protein